MTTPTQSTAGLEGVVAAPSEICFIDGVAGRLVYRGYEIGDLVENTTFEEVAYLLWNGDLPDKEQLQRVRREIGSQHGVPAYIMTMLRALPRGTEPMDALRTAVSALAAIDPDLGDNSPGANLRKAVRLTAQLPTIVAAFHRVRSDREVVDADPALSVAGNFLLMLTGKRPNPTQERVMDAALILHAEHGFNASTFAARVTAATLADMHAAVTAAVAALKGPLHGGANQAIMELLLQWHSPDEAELKVRQMLSEKHKVPGFGHRVYKTFDPRATFLRKMSRQLGEAAGNTLWYEMSERLIPVLKDEKNLNPNVDFFSASAYYCMGIPLDLFTPIFAIARVSGWTAHVMEQHRNNRIIRPQDQYLGPFDKKVVAVEQR